MYLRLSGLRLHLSLLKLKLIYSPVFCSIISHLTKTTQWEHPQSGKRYKVTGGKQLQFNNNYS